MPFLLLLLFPGMAILGGLAIFLSIFGMWMVLASSEVMLQWTTQLAPLPDQSTVSIWYWLHPWSYAELWGAMARPLLLQIQKQSAAPLMWLFLILNEFLAVILLLTGCATLALRWLVIACEGLHALVLLARRVSPRPAMARMMGAAVSVGALAYIMPTITLVLLQTPDETLWGPVPMIMGISVLAVLALACTGLVRGVIGEEGMPSDKESTAQSPTV